MSCRVCAVIQICGVAFQIPGILGWNIKVSRLFHRQSEIHITITLSLLTSTKSITETVNIQHIEHTLRVLFSTNPRISPTSGLEKGVPDGRESTDIFLDSLFSQVFLEILLRAEAGVLHIQVGADANPTCAHAERVAHAQTSSFGHKFETIPKLQSKSLHANFRLRLQNHVFYGTSSRPFSVGSGVQVVSNAIFRHNY